MKYQLPDGPVTLLLTDIEGSTRLLKNLGEQYAQIFTEHRELLSAAFRAHEGYEVAWHGDSSFAVFSHPLQAIAAAASIQRTLHEYSWPSGCEVRVRIGLHTGHPTLLGNDYIGIDVHRTARLMAAASGGQVLLSHELLQAVEGDVPAGLAIRQLGRHQLKDMTQAEEIYQLVIDGLPADFPPLKTIDLRPNNLPTPLTSFVGRDEELTKIQRLLRRPDVRLVTLTGTGGTGKTRLAQQVGAALLGDFNDGVFLIELAPIHDTAFIVPTIIQALGIREVAGQPPIDTLKKYLQGRQLLLLLDNFEHLIGGATMVKELLAACRQLKILVTSRTALRLYGEHSVMLAPLPVPDLEQLPSHHELARIPAVDLFLQRAQATDYNFQLDHTNAYAVAAVCAHLEGLPLAIELAVPQLSQMSPQSLQQKVEERFSLLTDAPPDFPTRHQTLYNTIEWSYNLLGDEEQKIFSPLGVFSGGFTPEAAAAVCRATGCPNLNVTDGLELLAEKSLLRRETHAGQPRFFMLETIREFAGQQLETSGHMEAALQLHTGYFLGLARQAHPHLQGTDQDRWLNCLRAEHGNVQTVMQRCLDCGDVKTALCFIDALWFFWVLHGHVDEGWKWGQDILSRPPGETDPVLLAQAGAVIGILVYFRGEHQLAEKLCLEALPVCRAANAKRHIGYILAVLSSLACGRGDVEQTQTLCEEWSSIAEEINDRWLLALMFSVAGLLALYQGDIARSQALCTQSLETARETGETMVIAQALNFLGSTLAMQGNIAQAQQRFIEGISICKTAGFYLGAAIHITSLAGAFALEGAMPKAARLLGAAETVREEVGVPLPPAYQPELQRIHNLVSQGLGEDAFTPAWTAGNAMTIEEAFAFALGQ